MPSDYQRIDNIIKLSKEGFTNRLLISHDIHTKHRLVSVNYVAMNKRYKNIRFHSKVGFGGHGYAHILNNVLPRFITYGLTEEQVDQITITNPADWLSFCPTFLQ